MREIVDRGVPCILGAVVGFVVWTLFFPAHMLWVAVFIGLLGGLLLVEIEKELILNKNSKIREETVALITHEMKTALTSTGWAIELVIEKYGDKMEEIDKKALEGVVESTHTTVMHTVNLLDVSLLDINKLSIFLEWVKLDKVEKILKEVLENYSFGAKQRNINMNVYLKLDPVQEVQIDMLRLRIVFENLMENAFQYTLPDKGEIKVVIENNEKILSIEVADNGIGIPEEEQKSIFNEFFRASNAKNKLSSGSGIGLYMCKQYVKVHRGNIYFRSQKDIGTTFYVTIPLKTELDSKEFLEKI
ncbi:MAG TPA: HAMP domain-containing sensor histidine kinase [Candidatus Paceibacterota bacterium]